MNKNYDKLLDNLFGNVVKALETTSFYWQPLSIVVCIILAVIFYKIFKTIFFSRQQTIQNPNNIVNRYLHPLFLSSNNNFFINRSDNFCQFL